MASKALGVGDNDPVSLLTEDRAQRVDFGRRTATASRCVGLMRHEHGLRRNLCARDGMFAFGLRNQLFHDGRDMLDVEARAMECAIR